MIIISHLKNIILNYITGQFNAAPTLLEKQQENLCARLKSLKERQSLNSATGSRVRFSSLGESSNDYGLKPGKEQLDKLI